MLPDPCLWEPRGCNVSRGWIATGPSGALPAGGWSTPFLPPFVGMTPLATDGPGSGSGAGFGRDHAEKWRSGGVSRTTLMVTKTTSLAGLNPASTRTRAPFPHQIPSGTGPRRRARLPHHPRPSRTGHASSCTRPARGGAPLPPTQDAHNKADHVIRLLSTAPEQALIVNPLIRGRSGSRRSPAEYDSKATP